MRDTGTSIIIVTYNSEEYIKNCLDSVFKVAGVSEIIVVDNNSTDDTRDILKKYESKITTVLNKKNLGYTGGMNLGIKQTNASKVLLLNPDTIVDKNFLKPLIKVMNKNEKVAACQPQVKLYKDKETINLTGKETQFLGIDWIRDYGKKSIYNKSSPFSFSGSGVLLDKTVLKKTRGFDPIYFTYFEDTDLSWRFRLFGYKTEFVPESVIYHDYRYKPMKKHQTMKTKVYYYERNRLITLLKNYSLKTLILILPALLLIEILINIYFLIKGWWIEKVKGYFFIIKNVSKILKKRKFVQSNRIVKDSEIVRGFESQLLFQEFNILPVKLFLNPLLQVYWGIASKFI